MAGPRNSARHNWARNWKNKRRIDGTFKVSKVGKFNANGRFINDHWFPSKAEGDRYEQLLEMQAAGMIDSLELQPDYPCYVNGTLICTYRADFRYRIKPRQFGQRVLVEDVKGMVTPVYAIKKKLVLALHGVEILELSVPKNGGVARFRYLTADQFGPLPIAGRRIKAASGETS